MLRRIHRIVALITALLMLYLGVTGTMIQILDLAALARHAPDNDPVVVSINEGRYGNGDIEVMTDADLTARPLPAGLDILKGFDTALQALHRDAPGKQPTFVELRQKGDATLAQARIGPAPHRSFKPGAPQPADHVLAWNISNGADATPVPVGELGLPPSLRQSLKEWHRFWTRRDVPGVWVELLSGLILWALLITGLGTYWQLMKLRFRLKKPNPFFKAGGTWRTTHRIVSLVSSLCLIMVAATGTWLGFESVWHTFAMPHGPQPEVSAPLSDNDVRRMASVTLSTFRRLEPDTPIKALRVRWYSGMPQGGVITGGEHTSQVLIDTATGEPASLTEPGYPKSGFTLGTQTHEDMKHLHSGVLFGLANRIINLIAGLGLIYLCVSGLVMYYDMWRKRAKGGRKALFWK